MRFWRSSRLQLEQVHPVRKAQENRLVQPTDPALPEPGPVAVVAAVPASSRPADSEDRVELERRLLLDLLIELYDRERSLTTRQLIATTFARVGVVLDEPVGRPDPDVHVVTTTTHAGAVTELGTIAAVERVGMRDRDRFVRPARVVTYGP